MTADWCCQLVEEAIEMHGKPEIINSDQGSQLQARNTQRCCQIKELKSAWMAKDGPLIIFIERLWKSVKYECIYLHAFEDGVQLYEGLDNYFTFTYGTTSSVTRL